jgi:hypothetical protein
METPLPVFAEGMPPVVLTGAGFTGCSVGFASCGVAITIGPAATPLWPGCIAWVAGLTFWDAGGASTTWEGFDGWETGFAC